MYSIPKDFDGSFLLNKDIETICFGQYQVNLHFAAGAWLQIEGEFEHYSRDGLLQRGQGFPIVQTTLLRLLGTTATNASFSEAGSLQLEMSNGDRLVVMGNNGMYEAYRLFDGKNETVI
jgi:hypothetical protein